MNTALILPWLNLPPGPWPPEDRALLGLPAGPVDAIRAETNALARMELLRPHQLKHPEVVTEGMNRLAQALIALTSTSEPTAPTVSLRKPPRKAPAKPRPIESPFPSVDLAPTNPVPSAPLPGPILDAEIILEAEVVHTPSAAALPLPAPIDLPPPGLVEVPEIPRSEDRRQSYRRLAYLRKLHRAWAALQPVLAAPSEPLVSAEMVYRLLVGSRDLRALLKGGRPRYRALATAGGTVLSLVAQPHAAIVLRELLPAQRAAVAMEWATAKASLEAQMLAVRKSLRRPRSRSAMAGIGRACGEKLHRNPEWILATFTALLILSGIARTLAR